MVNLAPPILRHRMDLTFGARAEGITLERVIQRLLQDPLAMRILEGEFPDGSSVRVDAQAGELTFS